MLKLSLSPTPPAPALHPSRTSEPPDFRALQPADILVRADVAFALFRAPGREPLLVLQRDGDDTRLASFAEVSGAGFVLAPFAEGHGHPVLFLRGEHVVAGWQAIARALEELARPFRHGIWSPAFALPDVEELRNRLFSLSPDPGYAGALAAFLADLHAHRHAKLVLSRSQDISGSFSPARIFARACATYPDALVSLCHASCGTWIGASPEVLVEGRDNDWRTMALAGTRKAGEQGPWDAKNLHEHAFVADYIDEVLRPFAASVARRGPHGVRAGGVEHLRTDFSFALTDRAGLGDVILALHPTPAVCGLPRESALQRILSTESLDRRYYAGYLGWWGDGGPTCLHVNLRCLKLSAGGVRLYAGGGIVPESTLEQEWRETCHKMCTMLAMLGQ